MAIAEGAAGYHQFFFHVVTADDDAFAARAPDEADAQIRRQLLGCGLPGVVQGAMVGEGDQRIACQGGQKLHLEQLEVQCFAGLPGGFQLRHQLVDAAAGDGEVVDQDGRVVVARLEHRVVALALVVPQAELGAQPIVLAL